MKISPHYLQKIRSHLALVTLFTICSLSSYATLTISTNTTWSSNRTEMQDVVVANGATLTINNNALVIIRGSLTMQNGGHIIVNANGHLKTDDEITVNNGGTALFDDCFVHVGSSMFINPGGVVTTDDAIINTYDAIEVQTDYTNQSTTTPGGRLFADNTTFNPYDAHWIGIEVWGMQQSMANPTAIGQHDYRFAEAQITNSTITLAHYALSNSKHVYTPIYNAGHVLGGASEATGGRLLCVNTNFVDNYVSVIMRQYENLHNGTLTIDASYFIKCDFTGTGTIPPQWPTPISGSIQKAFMAMGQVHCTHVTGCTFIGGNIDYGIYAEHSSIGLSGHCSDGSLRGTYGRPPCTATFTTSSMSDLRTAISAHGFSSYNAYIDGVEFTNNHYNIIGDSYTGARILNNNITATSSNLPYPDGTFMGIVTHGMDMFKIEDNTIDLSGWPGQYDDFGTQVIAAGIVINNAGTNANQVYHNQVEGVDYSMQGVGNNRNANLLFPVGLQFTCNTSDATAVFTHDILDAPHNFPFNTTTTPTTGMARFQDRKVSGNPRSAGNFFNTWSHSPGDVNHFYKAHTNDLYYSYDPLGSAREEPIYINSGLSTINKTEAQGLSCISNEHQLPATTYTSFATGIGNIATSIDALLGEPVGAEEEAELADLFTQYQQELEDIIDVYSWRDSIIYLDSIELALGQMEYLYEYRLMLAAVHARQHEYTDAINVVAAIPGNFTLETEEAARIANIEAVYELAKFLHDNDYDWGMVDGDQKEELEDIAENDDYKARYMAQYYLRLYEGQEYGPEYAWIEPEEEEKPGRPAAIAQRLLKERSAIYPNPVAAVLQVEVAAGNTRPALHIADVTGRVVLQQSLKAGHNNVNVATLAPGTYIAGLYDGDKRMTTIKLVKQ